jgi:hypothetical protein
MKISRLLLMVMAFIVASGLLLASGMAAAPSPSVDYHIYAGLLERYVHNDRVDYAGLKQEEALLDRYLDALADIDAQRLPDKERFAFFVNAYNAWTLKLILANYPGIHSIKELGSIWQSPWKKKIARIDGKQLTLDEIEHDILRPQFRDPRVHFAVNCASKGCPPLYDVPFNGRDLDRQLDHVTRAFINDPTRYRIDGNVLYVSRIFKWYGEDFNDDPLGFFKVYAEGDLKAKLQANPQGWQVKYLDYDWSLNEL